jgi:uncharacterized repeat protein (TIGR03803 family)
VVYRVDNANHGTVLYSFTGGADGALPIAPVICGSAGNLYGTTVLGGSSGAGVVYRVDGSGHQSVLYSFSGGNDGGFPLAGLIQDLAGNLYGTTDGGGSAGAGVVFKLDTKGHETILNNFTGGNDGAFPGASLILDSAGNFYGTCSGGGTAGAGVVFKLTPSGQETVLYSFTGGNDGGYPNAAVVFDSAGNLYGTTTGGGTAGGGVVFKLTPNGQQIVLYSFTFGADGGYPDSSVILDSTGNLYGTTLYGGASFGGVVYKVSPAGQETVLHNFTGNADGANPAAGVVSDSAGNLYGTASGGGVAGAGNVYKLDPSGNETVLYSFPGSDGSVPTAPLIEDAAGNLYGTASGGGAVGAGVVFKLSSTGGETILYSFSGKVDGANPQAGLIMDPAGNLYGTTSGGGTSGTGVVFKLDTSGHETVLYNFMGICCGFPTSDGASPHGIVFDSAGNIFGTTTFGGSSGWGTIYKLDASGHETILHNFTNGLDGGQPNAGVTLDASGNIYGTAAAGGVRGGVVYKLTPAGQYSVLFSFDYGLDGGFPLGGVTFDSTGSLYGTTWSGGPPSGEYPGVVYKIDSTGHESTVYPFTGFSDGGGPLGTLIFDSTGDLYGVTQYGGQGPCPYFGCGVVFKVDPSGNETVLYSFTGGSDGSEPVAGVILDSGGTLYGTTRFGGASGNGVVYKVTPGASAPTAQGATRSSFNTPANGPVLGHPGPWYDYLGLRQAQPKKPMP